MSDSIYDIEVQKMGGEKYRLDAYRGKVLLVVNTASRCGFTPQFTGLEKLHEEFEAEGLAVLGFPCMPRSTSTEPMRTRSLHSSRRRLRVFSEVEASSGTLPSFSSAATVR